MVKPTLRHRWVLAAAIVLIGVAGARAQEQRAAIEGVIRDTQAGVVPGVSVAVLSSGGLSVAVVSDDSGTYRFASLPPGQYELTATLAGFVPARVVGIDLTLGVQLTIDLLLEPGGLDIAVEVVSPSPLVAVSQIARATSVSAEDIEKMPHGRDFTSLAVQAPGAIDERKLGGISIDGASAAENRIVIDGVETTDTWIGTPGQFLATDFVGELQVKSSGYSAEYGGSTGGVLNVVTRAGGNAWKGDVVVYVSGDALDAGPRPTLQTVPTDTSRAEYVTYPADRYVQVEPGLTLGGPVLRDRIWFFGGYVPAWRPLHRTVSFLADGTTRTFRQELLRHNAAANLSMQAGPRWRTRFAYSQGSQVVNGLLPPTDGTGNPAADYSIDEINPNQSVSAAVDVTPRRWLYMSARTGYFFKNIYNRGVYHGDRLLYQTSSVGLDGVPPAYQQPRGYTNVPTNMGRDRGKGPRLGAQIDGTLFFAAAGQHQLKSGAQLDRLGLDALSGATGNGIGVFWNQSFGGRRGPLGYYRVTSNDRQPNLGAITQGDATVTNVGLFLQDTWTMGRRLTVHLGMRTEDESVPSLSPDPRFPKTAIHFGFGDKLAPRLGLAWDAGGDGRTKIYGSWGVFYDITKLEMSFGFGGFSSVGYVYTLDDGDISRIVDNPDCPPACPGTLIDGGPRPAIDPADNHIDPGLDPTRLREAVVGVERQIGSSLSVSARYVHKQIDRAVEDLGTRGAMETGITILIANPGLGTAATFYPEQDTTAIPFPRATRRYDALEIGVDRRLRERWSARVSYRWSRLYGNYSGLAQSDEDGRVAPNSGRVFDHPLGGFDEDGHAVFGVLATDRPHDVKASGVYTFRSGTSVGLLWFAASGLPQTREAAFVPGEDIPVMYHGRNSDGRLPGLSQLDVHVQQQLVLGQRMRLTFSANVTNLLNQSTPTNYYPTELFRGQAITIDERTFFRGIDTEALIAQQGLVRDPRFLMTSGYQAPRAIRVGVKLGF